MLGMRVEDLLPRSDPRNLELLRGFVRGGYRIADVESRQMDLQGRMHWLSNSLVGIVDGGYRVRAWCLQHDVTADKEMEARLEKASEEWKATFDAIHDLVMILDGQFRIVRMNAAVESFFHLPPEEIRGAHCYTLMHGTAEPLEECPYTRATKSARHEELERYDERRDLWLLIGGDLSIRSSPGQGTLIEAWAPLKTGGTS